MSNFQGMYLNDISIELKNIREILEKQSTAEKSSTIEVSEDCISREWVLNEMENGVQAKYYDDKDLIRQAPSVVPSRAEGEWIRKDGRVWSECSACGSGSSFETKFCGNCGADMRGEGRDD